MSTLFLTNLDEHEDFVVTIAPALVGDILRKSAAMSAETKMGCVACRARRVALGTSAIVTATVKGSARRQRVGK